MTAVKLALLGSFLAASAGISGDGLALIGVVIAALIAAWVGSRSASAQQVTSLGGRLDSMQKRLDDLERREGWLVEYVFTLRRHVAASGSEPPPPPPGLEL